MADVAFHMSDEEITAVVALSGVLQIALSRDDTAVIQAAALGARDDS